MAAASIRHRLVTILLLGCVGVTASVSGQTGGFFARTHNFPELAMTRLADALAGYYVLFLETPETSGGTDDVQVDLTRATGTVLARTAYSR